MNSENGHVLGNFPSYYTFNPVHERLRFMDNQIRQALYAELLFISSDKPHMNATNVLDIGCNSGDLTIGLYDLLTLKTQLLEERSPSIIDGTVSMANHVSQLNQLMQQQKRNATYTFSTTHNEAISHTVEHRIEYHCTLCIGDTIFAQSSGLSKKSAKQNAAYVALTKLHANSDYQKLKASAIDSQQIADTEKPIDKAEKMVFSGNKESNRRALRILGVDVDLNLIQKAKLQVANNVISDGDVIEFQPADVMQSSFVAAIEKFQVMKEEKQRKVFSLITCFSVAMWVHLNHGDDGLWQFLEKLADMTEHMLVELQPWKCYRNALKRLNRMRIQIPSSFLSIKVRDDIIEQIDTFLCSAGRFRFKAELGKTSWSRPVILYSRVRIKGIVYSTPKSTL